MDQNIWQQLDNAMNFDHLNTPVTNQYASPAANCSGFYNPYETVYDDSSSFAVPATMPAVTTTDDFSDRQMIPPPHQQYHRRNLSDQRCCWNCWSPNHHRSRCPDGRRIPHEVEKLRIKLGVPKPTNWSYNAIIETKGWPYYCFNCWENSGHSSRKCPYKRIGIYEREMLRIAKGIALLDNWKIILDRSGIKPLNQDGEKQGSGSFEKEGKGQVESWKRKGSGSWRRRDYTGGMGGGVKLGDYMKKLKCSEVATTTNGDGFHDDNAENNLVKGGVDVADGAQAQRDKSLDFSDIESKPRNIPVYITASPLLHRLHHKSNHVFPRRGDGRMNHNSHHDGGDGGVFEGPHEPKNDHVEVLTQISNHLGHLNTTMDEINTSLKTLVATTATAAVTATTPVTPIKPPHPLDRVNSLAHIINARVSSSKPAATQNGIFSTPEKHSLYHELGDITKRLAALEASCDLAMDDSATMQDGKSKEEEEEGEEESFTSVD